MADSSTPRPSGYVLKFSAGKYQGGKYSLPADSESIVGRTPEVEIVLLEDMVSRRHACITVSGDQVFLEDLRSANGTFVNGKRVSRCELMPGDNILIGTSIMRLDIDG